MTLFKYTNLMMRHVGNIAQDYGGMNSIQDATCECSDPSMLKYGLPCVYNVAHAEKEVDDTFAFSQEIGEPTEDENILQTELGGFALDLLDDNPSWMKQVTIQNLVVWEPIEPVSAKKKKPKRKKSST